MTTLREEIESIIQNCCFTVGNGFDAEYDKGADEIIKLFENKIDDYVKSKGWDTDDILEYWAINDIENLKKEILK